MHFSKPAKVISMRRFPVLCFAILLASTAVASAGDWTSYRNGNARTASTAENLKLPLKPLWRYTPPSPPRLAWSGQTGRTIEGHVLRDRANYDDAFHTAVVGNRAYFGSSADHQLHCVDLATGTPVWSFTTGGPVRLAPTVTGGRVYFGSDDGRAYCLNAADGKLVWKLRAGPGDEWLIARGEMISRWPVRTGVLVAGRHRGTAPTGDDIAYFGAGIFPHEDIFLYAVNAADGKIVWKRDNISESDAGRNDLSPQGYLLASESTLFVPSGRSLPAAIDRKTGKELFKGNAAWRGNAGGVVGGTKALLADGQLYSGGEHHFLTLDQKTGKVGYGYFEGTQMAVRGDDAFLATGSAIARVDRAKYAAASRRRQKLEMQVGSLARKLRGGKKAQAVRKKIEDLRKQIRASAKEGVKWSRKSGLESSLMVAGDLVFAGGQDKVVAFDAETGKDRWSMKVTGDVRGLAVANGRLLVSTSTGNIYCFGTTGQPVGVSPREAPVAYAPGSPDEKLITAAAEQILKTTGVKGGFCLVLGSDSGRLAFELAKRSQLKVYGIEPDEKKVAESRRRLLAAGFYGHRVTIHHADLNDIPYSNYFADLIVSESALRTGKVPGEPARIARHLKPVGGVMCFGHPSGMKSDAKKAIETWLAETKLGDQSKTEHKGNWITLTRGRLPGAGDWTHLYGNPGNIASTEDRRVHGGLGVLWYGDPGPGQMVNRHDGAVGPLAVNGKLFVQGTDTVMAYDAYNGRFLWKFGDKEALRTGVFQNYNPGNLVASQDGLFVMVKDRCVELDAETGKVRRVHSLPNDKAKGDHEWGYVAYSNGILYGTATVRKELAGKLRRRGRKTNDATDAIFAIDVKTGKHLWTYQGKNISHHTIALGPDKAYFVDATLTPEQRAEFLKQDKEHLKKLTGQARQEAEDRLKRQDLRLAVAIDARTGKTVWSRPVDVTDCSKIGTGGGELTLMFQNNVLILCGANANGHYWKQFLSGEFKQRRLLALKAETGEKLWSRDANYRHRPIIIEDQIIAEPWSFELYTGEQKMRPHPLTGKNVPWSIIRPGHHCGMLTGCPSMLMFRSGYTGFYDLTSDSGTRHFAGHRLGCWINAIPANGLVMIPEASAGCVCLFSIASTITLEPRKPRHPWTIYSAVGPQTPVAHVHLNLGAPGDRKDARGTVWLAYPRPNPRKVTGLDLKLDFHETRGNGGGYVSFSERSKKITGDATPWIYDSAARGITKWTFPLLGKNDKPSVYTVKLHFAELNDSAPAGKRVFDVKIQGKTVLKNFDPAKAAGGADRAVERTVPGIRVTDTLLLELVPRNGTPVLNAVEIIRQDKD
jgi:outer membrane protein assembly factor BamB